MLINVRIQRFIDELNIKNFNDYLIANKWKHYKSSRNNINIYQLDAENGFYQLSIPQNRDFIDYNEEVQKSLEILSKVENESIESTLNKITYITSNILKFRINNKFNLSSSAGLFDFANLGEQVKLMIKNTAMSELLVNNAKIQLSSEEIARYLESCEVGQSEIGSYIIPIILPIYTKISNNIEQLELFPNQSTGYAIATKLISNIETLKIALKSEESDDLISQTLKESNIKVGFCEAFSKIIPEANSNKKIEITPKWSPLIDDENRINKIVEIDSNIDKMKLKRVIKMINLFEGSNEKIIGRITKLKASPLLEDRHGGFADISYIDKFDKKKVISAILSDGDYKKAIDAHEEGRMVIVRGTLTLKKRGGTIICKNFEVIN